MTPYLGTIVFGLALIHTFSASLFKAKADRYPEGSILENLFHLLGEIEIVFGLWASVYFLTLIFTHGSSSATAYVESLDFKEPLFVFTILIVATTKPIIDITTKILFLFSQALIFLPKASALYMTCLVCGPLLGSLITEPAAMALTALILRDYFFQKNVSEKFKYITLATLFVNISIGGVLTSFAAPPVLMVAHRWNWDTVFMFTHFGWRAILAVAVNALLAVWILRKDLKKLSAVQDQKALAPAWVGSVHLIFLGLIVMNAHHPSIFIGALMLFVGIAHITKEFQDDLKIKESLLVAYFLAGLVVLGGPQTWWLEPIITKLNSSWLYMGSTILTAITDNAALTFLGSQVEGISEISKYALVAGAVSGGGLTVIANAPNPAGYTILQDTFQGGAISALKLFCYALLPTLIAVLFFWVI